MHTQTHTYNTYILTHAHIHTQLKNQATTCTINHIIIIVIIVLAVSKQHLGLPIVPMSFMKGLLQTVSVSPGGLYWRRMFSGKSGVYQLQ